MVLFEQEEPHEEDDAASHQGHKEASTHVVGALWTLASPSASTSASASASSPAPAITALAPQVHVG